MRVIHLDCCRLLFTKISVLLKYTYFFAVLWNKYICLYTFQLAVFQFLFSPFQTINATVVIVVSGNWISRGLKILSGLHVYRKLFSHSFPKFPFVFSMLKELACDTLYDFPPNLRQFEKGSRLRYNLEIINFELPYSEKFKPAILNFLY